MNRPSSGPVAVTGAASGMGAATVQMLLAEGIPAIGVDRRDADVVADLATEEGRHAAVSRIQELSDGQLGGLITCAGISGFDAAGAMTIISVNYFGTVDLIQSLHPSLVAGRGSVVAISSNAATTTPGLDSGLVDACLDGDEIKAREIAETVGGPLSYGASKLAVARWVRRHAPRPEWIGAGVRLNAIAPGFIETAMTDAMAADPHGKKVLDRLRVPAGRPGSASELAGLIRFLIADEGAYFVGNVLVFDGGTEALVRPDDWPGAR